MTIIKKSVNIIFLILIISSCSLKNNLKKNIFYYKKLSNFSVFKNYKKIHYNNINSVKFLVANYPDQTIFLHGCHFNYRYNKLIKYIKDNGYIIAINKKLPFVATIIAQINKSPNNIKYIGINMEQNLRINQTIYNIFYERNKFKAYKFYVNYKKLL